MITFKQKGDFKNTDRFFNGVSRAIYLHVLDQYGQMGVSALAQATPKDSGETANSWSYEVETTKNKATISWSNSHLIDEGNVPVAIILQYGHATGTGGFVQGRDFINPALRPIFDKMADDVWKAVTSL
jgi:hypothetical protein